MATTDSKRIRVEAGVYFVGKPGDTPHPPYSALCGRDGNGKKLWTHGHGSVKEAKAERRRIMGRVDEGVPLISSKATVKEAVEAWIDAPRQRELTPHTKAEYRRMARDYIYPVCGRKKIRDVGRNEIVQIIEAAKPRLGPATIGRLRTILSGTFREAKEATGMANPMEYVRASVWPRAASRGARMAKMKKAILSRAEIDALLAVDYQDDWQRPLYEVLIFAGLRIGEALGLRWQDIDLKAGRIVVRGQVRSDDPERTWTPHTKASEEGEEREVWIDEALVSTLRAYMAIQMQAGKVGPHLFVFAQADGKPRKYDKVYKRLNKACDRAGIDRRSPHKLRHTYASILFANGAQDTDVQEALGHDNLQVTLTNYQWMWDDPEAKATRMRAALGMARGNA